MPEKIEIDLNEKAKEIAQQFKGMSLETAKTVLKLTAIWVEGMAIVS